MIRALAFLCLSTSPVLADQACLDRYFPVSSAELTDIGMLEVRFRNESPYPLVGYGITYVFELSDGVVTDGFPSYFLKKELQPGVPVMHALGFGSLDPDVPFADIMGVTAYVSDAQQMVGLGHEGDTELDLLLQNCEKI